MEVVSRGLGQAVRIEIAGEVDMHNSPAVRAELLAAAARRPPLILVDLSRVEYIDSSGLATLVECLQHMAVYGGKLALVGARRAALDVFAISRLDRVFTFYASEEQALAAALPR
jgi:anti-sigma B factor antagonist